MPIKDISKEEQAHLFLTGGVKRELMQLTESDKGDKLVILTLEPFKFHYCYHIAEARPRCGVERINDCFHPCYRDYPRMKC